MSERFADSQPRGVKGIAVQRQQLISLLIFLAALTRLLPVLLTIPPRPPLSLQGQCLPNSLQPRNCPSASSNECQSRMAPASRQLSLL